MRSRVVRLNHDDHEALRSLRKPTLVSAVVALPARADDGRSEHNVAGLAHISTVDMGEHMVHYLRDVAPLPLRSRPAARLLCLDAERLLPVLRRLDPAGPWS